jgi:hypothetical protein
MDERKKVWVIWAGLRSGQKVVIDWYDDRASAEVLIAEREDDIERGIVHKFVGADDPVYARVLLSEVVFFQVEQMIKGDI